METCYTFIMDTIKSTKAVELLKAAGLSRTGMAEYLSIKPNSLTDKWRKGGELSISQALELHGYIALHDDTLQRILRHKDDSVILARLDQLAD